MSASIVGPTLFEPPTVEEGVQALFDDGKTYVRRKYEACQERVVNHPAQAVMIAAAAGYLIEKLPLRSIFITNMRLLAALTPPILFAVGAAKVCEYLQTKARQ
ncbi:hypothetical protein [Luteolibacter sp. LG18]|uniref:hypothetical protein n=1 Tax=Luteolibacter sp. LG18 TaxID=2819286 RepID=UPI002B2A61B4|nr:hypothetical protein llg_28970 [Luteolibacter sp. LG18]